MSAPPRLSHRDANLARRTTDNINRLLKKTDAIELSADQSTVEINRDVDVDGVLKIAGVQVVGTQQAVIANDASGAPNQATVNAILAALRAHGLIDT